MAQDSTGYALMKLEIVARSGPLFEGEVSEIVVPAESGELGILAGHTPLMAILSAGSVRYTPTGRSPESIEIERGMITFDSDIALVVADSAMVQ
ncbi:MAG: hypothetical protein MSS97_02755 [Arcanobacterium sp.]|nr:hypothetical protein [Arcanobacterium sp.]